MKKVIILKNDRTGDLFTSIRAINSIFNKHQNDKIEIFLSKINHKFSFLFNPHKIRVVNFDLNIFEKISIFFYFLFNKIDTVYILTPKNFYYVLPFILYFKKIKFYGICIDSDNYRPSIFLRKFLYKKIIINRKQIQKRNSTYEIQKKLVDYKDKQLNLINTNIKIKLKINFYDNTIFFHYKKNIFKNLLDWDLNNIKKLINFLYELKGSVIFSSEINDQESDTFFLSEFNSYDFKKEISNKINDKKILYLKNIDGQNLYSAINESKFIVAPEGIITHIGYHLKKNIFSLLFFRLKNKKDFIKQVISCKEWFPPNNFKYIVLKKDFESSIRKLKKRLI